MIIVILIVLLLYASWFPCAQSFGDSICKAPTFQRIVVLSFDEAPGEQTEEILSILSQENVTALFFVVGEQALTYPNTLSQIVDEGHVVGLQGMEHDLLYKNNEDQIRGGKKFLEQATGKQITLFRPPYGFRTPATMRITNKDNLSVVLWTSFSRDYGADRAKTLKRVERSLQPGLIIALRDGLQGNQETILALPYIIQNLKEKGYRFADASEIETLLNT